MSFFAELKRRNVFRVGIAYLIFAWLALQITDVITPILVLPDWAPRLILLILSIGFPFALFLAWAFELTPDGLKKDKDIDHSASSEHKTGPKLDFVIIGLLAVALGYFIWESRFQDEKPLAEFGTESQLPASNEDTGETQSRENSSLTPVSEGASIAVLPFVNMSSDPEQEYFSDGITEEIINALVKIPGLSVPARTSVFAFKGHQQDVRKIGRELGVSHVLEGSIRSQNNQVRITAQLITVDDGFHLWSETFDRELQNIFVVQEEIAGAIAQMLLGELGVAPVSISNQTVNMKAYDEYLQGRALLRSRGTDNLGKASQLLLSSIEADPNFAPAWAAKAIAHQVALDDQQQLAIDAAQRALELDPRNVEALDVLASVMRDSFQWTEAEKYFDQALAIDPDSPELLEDYAEFLSSVGRSEECLEIAARGYSLDPHLGPLVDLYVKALLQHKRYDEAASVIAAAENSGNHLSDWIWVWKLYAALAADNIVTARTMISGFHEDLMAGELKVALLDLLKNPNDDLARNVARKAKLSGPKYYFDAGADFSGQILILSGDLEFVIDSDIADLKSLNSGNTESFWWPDYQKVRQHSRFTEYLNILGLPEYWDATSWPTACERRAEGVIQCQ